MAPQRDPVQYGNEPGVSINHLLISMLHRILKALDKNSNKEKMAAILTLVEYKKAFENQSHNILGIKSFLSNGVRKSLIPVMIQFFHQHKIYHKMEQNLNSYPTGVSQGQRNQAPKKTRYAPEMKLEVFGYIEV